MISKNVISYLVDKLRLKLLNCTVSRNLLAWIGIKYVTKKLTGFKIIKHHPSILTFQQFLDINDNEIIRLGETLDEKDFIEDYNKFVSKGNYPNAYFGGHASRDNAFGKKSLEHFLSLKLALGNDWKRGKATILDVGANSPVFRNVAKKLNPNLDVYCVDISFPLGIRDYMVGVNGSGIPFPDASIDAIVLHCSYEEFEGHGDIALLKEAERILKPNGKAVIVPLYLTEREGIEITDPFDYFFDTVYRKSPVKFSHRARIAAIPNYGHRFVRFYSIHSFSDLLRLCPNLMAELNFIEAPGIIRNPEYIRTVRWVLTLTRGLN